METPEFQILGVTRIVRPEANAKGDAALAFCDFAIGPVEVRGCTLVRNSNGAVRLFAPTFPNDERRRVVFAAPFREAACRAALAAFRALGGEVG